MTEIIIQEKNDVDLINKGNEIISSLQKYNLVEKWKIIKSLYVSLGEEIKKEEVMLAEKDLKEVEE